MRILLIVDDYLPHSIKIAAKMMHELALEFIEQGHIVSVLTPNPSGDDFLKIENIDGVNVLFFRSGEIKNIGKVKRAINETMLSYYAWQSAKDYLKSNPHNAIVYFSPSIFWGAIVSKLKRKWGVKSYLILRDIFPQWTLDNGLMKKESPIYWYFKLFELINYKSANKIGVMSPSNLKFFKDSGYNTSKFEVLYNWAKPEINEKIIFDKHRNANNLNDKVVFFYGGNMGHAQDMMNLVRLAIRLKDNSDAHFLFVGKGDEVDMILKEKEKHTLNNITYLPSVDQKTYFEMLNEFDIGLFTLHPHHKTHNFPGKILGYMELSKPILGSVNYGNDVKELINQAGAGYIFDTGEDELLYQAALKLIESESKRVELGGNARRLLLEQFSVNQVYEQLINSFL